MVVHAFNLSGDRQMDLYESEASVVYIEFQTSQIT